MVVERQDHWNDAGGLCIGLDRRTRGIHRHALGPVHDRSALAAYDTRGILISLVAPERTSYILDNLPS